MRSGLQQRLAAELANHQPLLAEDAQQFFTVFFVEEGAQTNGFAVVAEADFQRRPGVVVLGDEHAAVSEGPQPAAFRAEVTHLDGKRVTFNTDNLLDL